MKKLKKPLIFSLEILPVSVIAVIFTCLYQFDLYPAEVIEEAVAVLGSRVAVIALSTVQSVGMIFACSFFGYILAKKTGLLRPFVIEKKPLTACLVLSVIGGIAFALDPWLFGKSIPEILSGVDAGMTPAAVIASILYGGIIEEIMLRLFMLSLLSFLLGKIFCRGRSALPDWVFITANIIAAVLFAAGHLPATVMTFGTLTPLLLVRCFLYNGGFGLLFGYLYRRYGIQYAMISHALLHIISKGIWAIFL